MPFGWDGDAADARKRAGKALADSRWSKQKDADDVDDDGSECRPRTAAQVKALKELALAARDLHRPQHRRKPERFTISAERSPSGNQLIKPTLSSVEIQPPSGMRLLDVGLLDCNLAKVLACPECNRLGVLRISGDHETRAGLASTLRWWCSRCLRTTQVEIAARRSESLAGTCDRGALACGLLCSSSTARWMPQPGKDPFTHARGASGTCSSDASACPEHGACAVISPCASIR